MVLPNRTGMKGARVDSATASVSGKEFRKGGVEIIGNKRGNDVFVPTTFATSSKTVRSTPLTPTSNAATVPLLMMTLTSKVR